MKPSVSLFPLLLPLLILLPSGCATRSGPEHPVPTPVLPTAFKEAGFWQEAQPREPEAPEAWWQAYGDATLDRLMRQVALNNQNVAAASAQVRQAAALLEASQASLWPTLTGSLGGSRGHGGADQPPGNSVRLGLNASWEADLWGRLGHAVEAGQATLAASQADLQATLLSTQSTLIQTWFQWRAVLAQQVLLARTVAAQEQSLQRVRQRYAAGVASRLDLTQAQAQWYGSQAQASDLAAQRARLEHALALLIGKTPGELADLLPAAEIAQIAQTNPDHPRPLSSWPTLPTLPPTLPATLLERRPDIAAAERRMAAANAAIGIARAAYFPALTFNASGGYQNTSLSQLLTLPHRIWSLGPNLAMTLFDGGARNARQDAATAAYDAALAQYRQSVLTAFQEVEDNLANLHWLREEITSQQQAVQAASEALDIAEHQYRAGTISYLNVVTAQTTAWSAQRTLLGLYAQQGMAHALLLKTFGGSLPPS